MLPGSGKKNLTQRASVHLDMARGLAALAVMFSHVRGLFFVPYHELSRHSVALDAFYGATTMSHQAVMVFFVLSGFLIVSSIVGSFQQGRWSWTAYLVNRVVRLSVVLIPALILCRVLDHIGMTLPSTSALYYHPVQNLVKTSVAHSETLRNFMGSLFYVQSILVQPFGSDAPLWSLSYEFWYYILFPVVLFAMSRKVATRMRVLYFLAAIFIFVFIGRAIALYFLIWMMGGAVAAFWFARRHAPLRLGWASVAGIVPLVCVIGFSIARPLESPFLIDVIVALGFAMWMYWIIELPERRVSAIYSRIARLVAGFSYTLYLTHFPVVFFIRARLIHGAIWQPDLIHVLFAAGIAMIAIAVAYGLAQATEAKTALFRHTVMGLFQ